MPTLYGIAFTANGQPPPASKIVGWKGTPGQTQPWTWPTQAEALEACDLDGWRGYVCEYPSGNRPPT